MKFSGKTKEQAADEGRKAAEVESRVLRDRKLKDCDWTQNRDVMLLNDKEWQEYRQALRDITKQAGWPFEIVWPEEV